MLIDTTLREGEQTFGVYFSSEEKQNCLTRLGRLGIEELELGVQGQEELPHLVRLAQVLAPQATHSVWCRAKEDDLRQAAALGCRINMGLPASERHARLRLGLAVADLPPLAARLVRVALEAGCPYVSLGLEDVSRADPEAALAIALAALEAGAMRVRLADSVGVLTPTDMQQLVRFFRQALDQRFPGRFLAVHCHNDFGLATANALTALQCGADYADVSVLGAGERAGIARLEELATYLTLQAGTAAYQLTELRGLCALVSQAAHLPPSRLHPVVGRDVFATESGLHVHAVAKDPALFEPYDPLHVQGQRRVGIGKKSGAAALRHVAGALGLGLPQSRVATTLANCRLQSSQAGRPLLESELRTLLQP